MSTVQRSKKGCWTCRLRRKKCSEGDVPCKNCQTRGVFCHGYGPKPSWKDRGEREREEAIRLRIHTRRRRSQPSQGTSEHPSAQSTSSSSSSSRSTPEVESAMPELPTIRESCCASSLENFDFGSLEGPITSTSVLDQQMSPFQQSPELARINQFLDFTAQDGQFSPEIPMLTDFSDPWTSQAPASSNNSLQLNHVHDNTMTKSHTLLRLPFLEPKAQDSQISESEIELVTNFLCDSTSGQVYSRLRSATSPRSWLLFLLMHSPTFYFTSLSISAYNLSHNAFGDRTVHSNALQDHLRYRAKARQCFRDLLQSPISSFDGEVLICGVQIAKLEVILEILLTRSSLDVTC